MGKKQTATTGGHKQAPSDKPWLKCGEVGTYARLNNKRAKPKFERDHAPSAAAMLMAAKKYKKGMSADKFACVKRRLKDQALTIAIPKSLHRGTSRTCGPRNKKAQIKTDSEGLSSATNKDLAKIQKKLNGPPKHACADAYREAAKQVRAQPHEALIKKVVAECPG
jgi:hypothetical protein